MRENIYSFIDEDNSSYPFFIQMAGVSYCDGTYYISREKSGAYVFEYIIEGKGTVEINSKKFTAKAGDVYILEKNSRHKYYSDSKEPWTKIWFNVSGDLVDSLMDAYKVKNINYFEDLNLKDLFDEFVSLCKDINESNYDIFQKCSIVFHKLILKTYSHIYRNDNDYICPEAQKMKNYLDTRIKENVSLEELSKVIYLSPSQAIRIFKKNFNKTPYNYLMDRKIETAKLMLGNSNVSVNEISKSLGFADQHYFSNYFKMKVGTSPSIYRNSNRFR